MLSDSAVHAAFTESIVPGRRERVVKCRERTLRKLIGVEDQWLEEQSSMLGVRERDEDYTIICSVFSVFSGFSGTPKFLERSAL